MTSANALHDADREREIYLSNTDVCAASQLTAKAESRLLNLSEAEDTLVCFNVKTTEHLAAVVVKVAPVLLPGARHHSYEVIVYYQLCCDALQASQITDQIQDVYDAYVQAVRLRLHEKCYEELPSLPGAHFSCCEDPRARLTRLVTEIRLPLRRPESDDGSRAHTSEEGNTTLGNDFQPLPGRITTIPASSGPSSDVDKPASPNPRNLVKGDTSTTKKRKLNPTSESVSDDLIKNVLGGLSRANKRVHHGVNPSNVQAVVAKCLQSGGDDAQLDVLLQELEKTFAKAARSGLQEAKVEAWINWYFSVCLRHVRFRRRKQKRETRAAGAYVLNAVVNGLLITEGINALAPIAACAELGFTLYNASRASASDQEEIITRTICGLRGRLESPPDGFCVPNVAAWITTVLGSSLTQSCYDLGLPNFALFSLGPELVKVGGTAELLRSVSVSVLEKQWQVFDQMVPHLQTQIAAHDHQEWTKLSDADKFSMTVQEWCRHQHPLPDSPTQSTANHSKTATTAAAPLGSMVLPLLPLPEPLNASVAPRTFSHMVLSGCSDNTLAMFVPQEHFNDSRDSTPRSRSGTRHGSMSQQVLERGVGTPEGWSHDVDGGNAGQEVAQTLLQLRDPRAPGHSSPCPAPLESRINFCPSPPSNALTMHPWDGSTVGADVDDVLRSSEHYDFTAFDIPPVNTFDINSYAFDT